ncbi:MAG: hypothetical protein U0900_03980 [Myxococcota bacterium]
MIHYSDPPVLLHDVIGDLDAVVGLLERNAPYHPLGGWFRPGVEADRATSALWFQKDWVHADLEVPGSELFLHHERVIEAARRFYGAEVVVPHTLYVNLMTAIEKSGPAHTDNPKFRGRDRTNTPMFLLRAMLWSGLFDRWSIVQATSIWWMNDVEGGGLLYWPDGPDEPPHRHATAMANTALVGDNHGMFHQVEPVGPFAKEPIRVTPRAELAPVGDGSGEWAVRDRGETRLRALLDRFRVSVLWKADVYPTEEERLHVEHDTLSLEDVARIFDADLAARGVDLRIDLARIADPGLKDALGAVYPEAIPVGARPSTFDGY